MNAYEENPDQWADLPAGGEGWDKPATDQPMYHISEALPPHDEVVVGYTDDKAKIGDVRRRGACWYYVHMGSTIPTGRVQWWEPLPKLKGEV